MKTHIEWKKQSLMYKIEYILGMVIGTLILLGVTFTFFYAVVKLIKFFWFL